MSKKKRLQTIGAIKKKFKNEWLLLADCVLDPVQRPLKGKVIAHSKDRDDIYKKQLKIKRDLCIFYAGKIPKDLAVVL